MRYHSCENQAELAHVQGAWLLDLPFFVIFALLFVPPEIHAGPTFAEDFGKLSRATSASSVEPLRQAQSSRFVGQAAYAVLGERSRAPGQSVSELLYSLCRKGGRAGRN
jgi:hypothetical protein